MIGNYQNGGAIKAVISKLTKIRPKRFLYIVQNWARARYGTVNAL